MTAQDTTGPQACPVGEVALTLWSDTDIIAAYHRAFGRDPDVHTFALMCWIRDDMAAEVAGLTAKLSAANATIMGLDKEDEA